MVNKNGKNNKLTLYLKHNITYIDKMMTFKLKIFNDNESNTFNINRYCINSNYILFYKTNINNIKSFNKYQVFYTTDLLQNIETRKLYQGNIIPNGNISVPSQFCIKPKPWNNSTKKGGFIKIKCNILIISDKEQINVDGMGCYGKDIIYNKGNDKSYDDRCLKLLHYGKGSSHRELGSGGGIIEINCNELINYGNISSNGFKKGSGGSIFILCKAFNNYGNIYAKGNDNNNEYGNGRIAIYCEEFINNGNVIPKPYIGKYIEGKELIDKRLNIARNIQSSKTFCYKNNKEKWVSMYIDHNIKRNIETTINEFQFKIKLYNGNNSDYDTYININNENIYCNYVWFNATNINNIELYNKYDIICSNKNNDNNEIKINDDKILHWNANIDNCEDKNTIIISSPNYIKPNEWSIKWDHNTNKGGYIQIKCDTLIISPNNSLNVDGMGYYGNNEHNKGKGTKYNSFAGYGSKGFRDDGGIVYGNKELTTLYHGSGCMDKNEGIGGGIIDIQCNKLINFGHITSNGYKRGSGGSIFIASKSFINYGDVTGLSSALGIFGDGRIAFYCDEYINKGYVNPVPFNGSFKSGQKVIENRENI